MLTPEEFAQMQTVSYEDYKKMQEAMNKADEDDTPRLAVVNDELHVLGDPAKTEAKPHTYTVRFAFPNIEKYKNENIILETPTYLVCERTYENVFIPSRRHTTVVSAFTRVETFFKDARLNSDGEMEVEDIPDEDIPLLLETFDDELVDAASKAVAKILKIDDFEADCIVASSAVKTVTRMMADIPEVVNDADYFFGS